MTTISDEYIDYLAKTYLFTPVALILWKLNVLSKESYFDFPNRLP